MRIRLVHTQALLLLSAVLIAVLAMGALSAWNLRNGFSDYLATRDVERLEQFALLVSDNAEQAGGIDALEASGVGLQELFHQFGRMYAPPPILDSLKAIPAIGSGGMFSPPPRHVDSIDAFKDRVVVYDLKGQARLGRTLEAVAGASIERPVRVHDEVVAFVRMVIVQRFALRATQVGLKLSFDAVPGTPENVRWDAKRIEQLVGNLIDNSLRYTDAPGQVIVRLRSRDETRLLIEVEDTAPSVCENELIRIFEPLFRSDVARGRSTGGSGLGLAICEQIAKAHHGVIRAEVSALGGVLFRLELPRFGDEAP